MAKQCWVGHMYIFSVGTCCCISTSSRSNCRKYFRDMLRIKCVHDLIHRKEPASPALRLECRGEGVGLGEDNFADNVAHAHNGCGCPGRDASTTFAVPEGGPNVCS